MGVWDWQDRNVKSAVEKLFSMNLCVEKNDNLLILSDTFKERIGEIFFLFALQKTPKVLHHTYEETGGHGIEPPESVWRATFGEEFVNELKNKGLMEKILKKEIEENDEEEIKEILLETTSPSELPTVVVAVNRYSISHTLYRKLCSEFLSIRFASMPLFEPFMFLTSMQGDWKRIEFLSKEIAKLLTEAEKARLTCPYGTELVLSLTGREGLADTGILCKPGSFGNLPAGEAFIAPVEGTSEGVLVTLYAPDRNLEEPVKLKVEKGKVTEVTGEKEFSSFLENLIHTERNGENVAELGIGTNDKAKVRTNILEAEKILGTCHVAIGDNSSFGGKIRANVHVDLLVENPTLELLIDGKWKTILERGKLKI